MPTPPRDFHFRQKSIRAETHGDRHDSSWSRLLVLLFFVSNINHTIMSLIHALVARGTTVLAEHSQGSELKPGT